MISYVAISYLFLQTVLRQDALFGHNTYVTDVRQMDTTLLHKHDR